MELIRGLHNLRDRHRHCALTIGNFDGVHLGHQAIIRTLISRAREMNIASCLMSFEPLPGEYFSPQSAPPRLTKLREKWCALENSGLDEFLCVKFDHRLAELSADEFIQHILVDRLAIRLLVIGDDFHFGRGRSGNFELLCQAGETHGFEVINSHSICLDDERISSTRIRNALASDDLELANRLLGRKYTICGKVSHGDKRGRTIGFPTANIRLKRHATPLSGVYAVSLHGATDKPVDGVANMGKRPTVDGQTLQLEVHCFDFDRDIYGHEVCVEFKHKIRDEQRFESFDALKQQIECDCQTARDFFDNQ